MIVREGKDLDAPIVNFSQEVSIADSVAKALPCGIVKIGRTLSLSASERHLAQLLDSRLSFRRLALHSGRISRRLR
jgi:hypothetical protein